MALGLPIQDPGADPSRLAAPRMRRCTYRRLIQVEAKPVQVYDVECLFPDRKLPIPLGDLDSAVPICNACTAGPLFRPDDE
jgi:hypothetical protein